MTRAPSAKPYFRALSGKGQTVPEPSPGGMFEDLPVAVRPREEVRRALDLYPTGAPEATRGLLARDRARIEALGTVWEPAAGYGHMVREFEGLGLSCIASDIADHGCPGVIVRDFYDWRESPAPAIITNPPYCEINARDGHGRWLRHTLDMPGWRYLALLLSWDWPAARANGLGELLDEQPFSYCYLMRWKLDFTGEGSPPQRNAWFVWDRDRDAAEPAFRFMNRDDGQNLAQGALEL